MNLSFPALHALGFSPFETSQLDLDAPRWPGRVCRVDHRRIQALSAEGPRDLALHPSLVGDVVVGDWLLVDADGVAVERLERRTTIARAAAGRGVRRQVIVANVDRVLVVMGLDGDFNVRRLERYLAICADADVEVAVLLTKAAAHAAEAEARRAACLEVAEPAGALGVEAIDVVDGIDPDAPKRHLAPGRTVALLGSSGAGKSTLANHLLGDAHLATGPVRSGDDRGRHTTTHRELVAVPDGAGLLVDNPGMRELALWLDGDGLARAFADVEELAAACRFADCGHEGEPDCAVLAAVEAGNLDAARLASFQRLRGEAAALERRRDVRARRAHEKGLAKHYRAVQRQRRRRKGS